MELLFPPKSFCTKKKDKNIVINKLFFIENLTRLQPLKREKFYTKIDLTIKRHNILNIPTINAITLKRAILNLAEKKDKSLDFLKKIRFFQGNLILFPIRSMIKPYELVTSQEILTGLKNQYNLYSFSFANFLQKFEVKIITDEQFRFEINELLVLAKISFSEKPQRVWYEEMIPRQCIFITMFQSNNESNLNMLNDLIENDVFYIGGDQLIVFRAINLPQF